MGALGVLLQLAKRAILAREVSNFKLLSSIYMVDWVFNRQSGKMTLVLGICTESQLPIAISLPL